MYKLKDTALTPRCGWIYTVPETKTKLQANTFLDLVDLAMENYEINHIDRDRAQVNAEIQDYICKRIPNGLCKGLVNHFVMNVRQLTEGTQSLGKVALKGESAYVEQEISEERAKICADCQFNAPVKGGVSGNGIPELVARLRRGRTTSIDDQLHICAICRCFVNLLVHVHGTILMHVVKQGRLNYYPDHCWKKREIEHLRRQP